MNKYLTTWSTNTRVMSSLLLALASISALLCFALSEAVFETQETGLRLQARPAFASGHGVAVTATVPLYPGGEIQPLSTAMPVFMTGIQPKAESRRLDEAVGTLDRDIAPLPLPTVRYVKDMIPADLSPEALQKSGLGELMTSGSGRNTAAAPAAGVDDEPLLDEWPESEGLSNLPDETDQLSLSALFPDESAPDLAAVGHEAAPPSVPVGDMADLPIAPEQGMAVDEAGSDHPVSPNAASVTAQESPAAAPPVLDQIDPMAAAVPPQPPTPSMPAAPERPTAPPAPAESNLISACSQTLSRYAVVDICHLVFVARRFGGSDEAADLNVDGVVNAEDLKTLANFYKKPALIINP